MAVAEYPDDLAVARSLDSGDERAFTRFFDEYFPRLYRFALARFHGDAEAAEEAAQRALCRAVRKFGLYRGEASLLTWLCQICRHEIADMVKQSAAQRIVAEEEDELRAHLESLPADEAREPPAQALQYERTRLIQLTLDHLPARYGDVLEWKYIEGLRVDEIAQRLAVSTLAAESLLARARRAFPAAWQSIAGEPLDPSDFASGVSA